MDFALIRNSEIIQHLLKSILCHQAGVTEIAFFVSPLMQTAVIIQLQIIADDKRHNIMPQTFLEEQQPPNSSVSILKRVDALEAIMKFQQIVKALPGNCVIVREQFAHLLCNPLRLCRFPSSHLVWNLFIVSDSKPIQPGIGSTALEYGVKLLDKRFTWCIGEAVDHHVDTLEMIGGLHYIINLQCSVCNADGIRFENISRLLMGETASLHVVGVIGQVDLNFVINAAG